MIGTTVRRQTAALALAIFDVVGYAALVIWGAMILPSDMSDPVSAVMFLGAIMAFSGMGALLIRRAPANLVGPLLLAVATTQVVGTGFQMYGIVGASPSPAWPGFAIASALTDLWYIAPFVIALVGVPLVFPDGRLPSRRFRWVVLVIGAGFVSQTLAGLAPLALGPTDAETVSGVLMLAALGAFVFGFGGAAVAVWVRFRGGDPVQRQQVKWLLADAGVALVAFPPAMILGSSDSLLDVAFWAVGFGAYLGLPIAIGIAILRYRLYEIDRLISRTIGYAIVTATLAVVFVGGILLFAAVLTPLTGGNTLGVAASTLVVVALFGPLRRRVQRVVDRRFNRARYDAERVVTAFAAQLRDDVDLESVSADVLRAVDQTVAPATVGLWIRRSEIET